MLTNSQISTHITASALEARGYEKVHCVTKEFICEFYNNITSVQITCIYSNESGVDEIFDVHGIEKEVENDLFHYYKNINN